MKKVILLCLIIITSIWGQNTDDLKKKIDRVQPGDSRFLLRGYAHSGLEVLDDESSFVGGSFNPIFLWQQSDRLLFEAELELELEDGETHLALEYANMSYILNDYATIRLGKFLMPFGTFAERLHPRWINRLPSNPLGFGHESVGPARDLGIELRGGSDLGTGKINYSVYVSNGPGLNDGTDPELEAEEAGMLNYDNSDDNNPNKAIGGRLGILPLSNSSIEIGISGQYAKVGNHDSDFEDIGALLYAFDFSYVNKINFLKGFVDIKGQFNGVDVDQANYLNGEDSSSYRFDNLSQAYYVQLSYRPANIGLSFFEDLEFVGRYSSLDFPEGALWEGHETQYAFGINYWLDWRTVIKLSYQTEESEGGHGDEAADAHASSDAILLHWSFGF
ncbi:MAG: hypothetical protein D8M58_17445 [Calditrichaeota bacterium]|nr:MAG: hypothetical protein DWQ03_01360 [Calditrichota bacterium]MBL1207192.1 hypothetical protein [Calditrichota bacterium]NOG47025.1 hypothetical protein [Calditrichota bacterium]